MQETSICQGPALGWTDCDRHCLTGVDARNDDIESADRKAVQNAIGVIVAQHQFSDLSSFKGDGGISKLGLVLKVKGLIFGDDGDADRWKIHRP